MSAGFSAAEEAEVRRLMTVVRRALWAEVRAFPAEMDDMLAEAYVAMWQARGRWDPAAGKTLEQWVLPPARWAAFGYLRRVWRSRRLELPLAENDVAVEWMGPLLAQWDAERFWAEVWARSSELERRCLAAVHREGVGTAEAASRLGLPATVVQQALQRVRQRTLARCQPDRAKQTHGSETHCRRGHPLDGDNLYRRPSGRRACRECERSTHRGRWHRYAERRRDLKRERRREVKEAVT